MLPPRGGGRRTLYAHLSLVSVREGECVERGTVIGKAGATGLVAAAGLYFEVRQNGVAIDPLSVLARNPP
jgi:murein DD-endopeptidase MepM/ murein hydrolase activator NlpD